MRLTHLVIHELRLAHVNGILVLYVGLTACYLTLLSVLMPDLHKPVATFIVFTDPAAMGMAFMGAVVLLEKNQRVTPALAVTPLPVWAYMAAKVMAFAIIGTVVAAVIAWYLPPYARVAAAIGVAITSVGFSLMGMVIGASATTLNGYMAQTMGPVIVISVPALLHLIGILSHPLWILHPGVAALRLIQGEQIVLSGLVAGCWTVPLGFIAYRVVTKALQQMDLVQV